MAKTRMDDVLQYTIENVTSLEELENWADYYEDHRLNYTKAKRNELENLIQTKRIIFRRQRQNENTNP